MRHLLPLPLPLQEVLARLELDGRTSPSLDDDEFLFAIGDLLRPMFESTGQREPSFPKDLHGDFPTPAAVLGLDLDLRWPIVDPFASIAIGRWGLGGMLVPEDPRNPGFENFRNRLDRIVQDLASFPRCFGGLALGRASGAQPEQYQGCES